MGSWFSSKISSPKKVRGGLMEHFFALYDFFFFWKLLPSLLNTLSSSQSDAGVKGLSLSQLTSKMAPCPSGPQVQLA